METRDDTLVIGAGVCGLYAALTLAREGQKVVLVEKEERLGGLAAGFQFGENFCDFGVHMLHAFNKAVFEDCASLMDQERVEVALDARIKWGNTLCRYPLRFTDMLGAMPIVTLFRCVLGLLIAEVSGSKKRNDAQNAEDALIAYYGAPLYEFFFEEFTHKYWGIHPKELSAEFVRRKMPRLSAVDFFRKLFPSFKKQKEGLVESALDTEILHYSRTGSETLPRVLAREFERLGGRILLGEDILSVCRLDGGFSAVCGDLELKVNAIVNTAPLPVFLSMLEHVPRKIVETGSMLKYKPTVVSALLVNNDKCMNGLYTYYRNRVFHRVGEPKNAGMQITPAGHTLLLVESTCSYGDERWEGQDVYRSQVLEDLASENIVEQGDIVDWKHLRNAYGYPIYALGYEEALNKVISWVQREEGLWTAGRQGAFTYPAMHTAMQMGKDAADEVLKAKLG